MDLSAQAPSTGQILAFALPLMLGLMTTAVNSLVDAVFMGRLGTAALAAVPLASWAYLVGWLLVVGTVRNAMAFCAQAHGAGRPHEIGTVLAHYHLLALAGLPLLVVYIQVWPLLSAFAHLSPQVDGLARTYLHIRVADIAFSLLLALYSAFFQAIGNSVLPMAVNISVVALNIALDYGLVFGHFGLPALGVAGSALATVLAQAAGAVAIMAISFGGRSRRRFALRLFVRPRWALLVEILRVGVPSGLGDCVDVSAWALFQLFVGRLGEVALAASNIGMQITQLLFLPGFAFGLAGASYIGRFLGARRPRLARRAARHVLALGVGYMGLLGLPLWFFGGFLARLFTDDPAVVQQATLLFKLMALYQVFDGMGFITRAELSGAGDTRVPTLLLIACVAGVMVPVAPLLAGLVTPPLIGAWLGASVFMVVYAGAMQWRLHRGAWTHIRLVR